MYDSVTFHGKTFKPFISNEVLEAAMDSLAERVNAEYGNSDEVPIFLCVLNGAIMFTAAMMKRLNFTAELMSIKLSPIRELNLQVPSSSLSASPET